MPIPVESLRGAASRLRVAKARNLSEARTKGLQTVFLCHSHLDQQLVKGAIALLEDSGWQVYVDWADVSMPEKPNRETATKIKEKIISLNYFIFLATANSMSSRWCPWEIGYADGKKPIDRILIFPTTENGRTNGNEYLDLYRRIDMSAVQKLGVFDPGQTTGVLVEHLV